MCPSLSDLLKFDSKSKLLTEAIQNGQVYKMKLTPEEGVSPKDSSDNGRKKYFIVVGQDVEGNAIGFVLINSKINKNLPQQIKDLHYPLKASEYQFLNNDSFVNCADFKIIKREKFDLLLSKGCYKGDINAEELEYIVETVKASPKIAPKTLKKFNLV